SIARAAHFDPPSSDRFSRESCRIVINADAHPPLIFRDVVDTVWNGLAEILIHEVMNTNFLRAALWLPFTSVVFKVADQFFLFGIDRDGRLTAILDRSNHDIDMLKLRIPIRMRRAFPRLAIALQTIARRFQQTTHSILADFAFSCRQLTSQSSGAFARLA